MNNTNISNNLVHNTKFIDPRSGRVLREGTTPSITVGDFKANPTPVAEKNDRLDNLEKGMSELKELLIKSLEK